MILMVFQMIKKPALPALFKL